MEEWVLRLPWRRWPLSMNSRWAHWSAEAKVKQEVKTAAWALARQAKIPPLKAIGLELVYYPGRNIRIDGENGAPTLKYCCDGLILAGVLPDDDSERVLISRSRAVIRRNDPADGAASRMDLVIKDMSALAPIGGA